MQDKIELLRKDLEGYRNSQLVASQLAQKICAGIRELMTEADAHALASDIFKEAGVSGHWHHPVIGFGPGTLKIKNLRSIALGRLLRRNRRITKGDLLMVDIAPIINGYPSDYTETCVFGQNGDLNGMIDYTHDLANRIVEMIPRVRHANELWHWAKNTTRSETGYLLAHPPVIWLGHRIQKFPNGWPQSAGLRFIFLWMHFNGSFVSATNQHPMRGLWAIEPYILGSGRAAKWEELVYYGRPGNRLWRQYQCRVRRFSFSRYIFLRVLFRRSFVTGHTTGLDTENNCFFVRRFLLQPYKISGDDFSVDEFCA